MSKNPRPLGVSLHGSHPPNKEQGVRATGSEESQSPGNPAGSGDRADPSHLVGCKPEHLAPHDDEDYPTPPVTPATWGVPSSSAGLQALRAQPPSPPRRGRSTAWMTDRVLEGCVDGHEENRPETYGNVRDAVSGAGHASDKVGENSPNDTHSRPHGEAATSAVTPMSSLAVGRLREGKVWLEMKDFFQDDEDGRSSRTKSHEATGGVRLEGEVPPHHVILRADKYEEGCDGTKHLEGACSDAVSTEGTGATEIRNTRGIHPSSLLSEEFDNFLCSDDDGDDNKVPRRRRLGGGDATKPCDRISVGVPATTTRERFGNVETELNVEHEIHDLEQKRTIRREFDSFLFSDDESGNVPGRKVRHERYNGGGGSSGSCDDSGDGVGHEAVCTTERQRARGLEEHGKPMAKNLDDTFSGDKRGSSERRGWPGSDNSDSHANVDHGKHHGPEQRASTSEGNTMSPHTSDFVDSDSRPLSRTALEPSDARGGVGDSGYDDGDGGTSPTSVATLSYPNNSAPITTHETSRSRASSMSPTSLVGQAKSARTIGMDAIPVNEDGKNREGRASWRPPTAMTTGERIPPSGRAGWSAAATKPFRKNHTESCSKRVGRTSWQEAYSAHGESSRWEAWLNSDGDGESDNDEQTPLAVREESHGTQEDQGDPPLPTRKPSRAKTLPTCTEVDRMIVAHETSTDQDDVRRDSSRTPSFGATPTSSRCPQQQHHQQHLKPHHSAERHGEVGVTAGLGRRRRPSGTWALDNATHDGSFSGFSSEIGSKSSIEVHNFLEESVESTCEDGGSQDAAESTRGDGLYYRGRVGDGNNNYGGNDLDAQDIKFLSDEKVLREVLLAVEDLHFSELPLTRQVELMRGISIVHFSSGDVIFGQGDLSDALYFMLGPTTDPEADGHDNESIKLTTETNEKDDEARGCGGDELKRELPFDPSRRFFGEEGLVYSRERRRSYTARAAVGLSLAVVHWPAFPHWRDFRLYLLMRKVSLLSKLPGKAQTAVLRALKYADYDPGELIIREGENGDKFYMITRGTVVVTAETVDSQGSVYSSSSSSSAIHDDEDDNLSDETDFMAAFSSPVAIADDEDLLSGVGSDSRDEEECRGTDAFKAVFLPRTGAVARQKHTAAAGASEGGTNAAGVGSQREEVDPPRIGSAVGDANMDGNEGEEARVAQYSPSQAEFQEQGGRGRWSGIDSLPTEKVLTRLYEGNCFGEMGLIYDEPRNASVRAMTQVTCVYLNKNDFRKCLCDNTFNSLMQQVALQTACYREQKAAISGQRQRHSARSGSESPTNFPSVRALAAARGSTRSSFRATKHLTLAGDGKGATAGRVINEYRMCEKVGEGSFGAVYKVVNTRSGETYAMKVITKPKRGGQKRELFERSFRREVSVMQMLRHQNVVTLWEVIDDPRSRKVYMIQEFMEGGSLFKENYAVEPIPEQLAISKFVQAARGLQYIHSFGICHGDIKPSNILEDAAGRVKIADFGACVILHPEDEGGDGDISSGGNSLESLNDTGRDRDHRRHRRKKRAQRVGGTPSFHPPELFGEGGFSRISFASDLWALGVTLYQMIVGNMPFFGRSYRALMVAIKMEEPTFPSECQLEPYLVNLLQRMLDKNPKTRITLKEAMNHEWVTKEGVCPGGEIEIPGRDRRLSGGQKGIPHIAGARGEYKQQRAASLRGVGASASVAAAAGTGANGAKRTKSPIRNNIGSPKAKDKSGSTTSHRQQFSVLDKTETRGDMGDKTLRLPSPMNRSRSYHSSSLSTPGAPVGEGNDEQKIEHHQHNQQQYQQRRQQPKQEHKMQEGGRGGKSHRGHQRRFGQEAAVAAAKRQTNMNEEEVEEDEEDEDTSTWSDGDDKIPSPRVLEDIVDNWHLHILPGMFLQARTVTLPEEFGASGGSGSSGGNGPIGCTPCSSRPPVASATSCAPGLQQHQHQHQHQQQQQQQQQQQHQQGKSWGSGTTCSTAEGGVEYRQHLTSPRLPLAPPLLGVSSTSSRTPTPPLPIGLMTTSGDRLVVQEIERERHGETTTTSAATASSSGNATAWETDHHVGIPTLTNEGGGLTTATATTPQLEENKQWHRGQQPQMSLSSLPFSSPSLLCRNRSTRQNEEENPAGGGGRGDEGNFRSICSCPAIGSTDASPLYARHELTDRSAFERSQRLVRKPDFFMLRANPTLGSNKRVVISSLKAVTSLRASAEGEVGSRRSSVGMKSSKSSQVFRYDAPLSEFKTLGEETDHSHEGRDDRARHRNREPPIGGGARTVPAIDVKIGNQSIGPDREDSHSNNPRSSRLANCEEVAGPPGLLATKSTTYDHGRSGGGIGDTGAGGGWASGGSSCEKSRRGSNKEWQSATNSEADQSESSFRAGVKLVAEAEAVKDEEEAMHAIRGAERSCDLLGWGRECLRGPVARDVERDGGGAVGIGEPAVERRNNLSRLTMLTGVDEGMDCIEEEPEHLDTTPPTLLGGCNATVSTTWSGPRVTSDSSTSHGRNGEDRTGNNSTCTSYFESSGAESGNCGREKWRYGTIPETRQTELGDTSFQGAKDGVEGGGAGGGGGYRSTWLVSADEGDGEGAGEYSSGNESSSDGVGESASVADITDCLDVIGEAMIREDPELRTLGSEEILKLTRDIYRRTYSNKFVSGGGSSGAMTKQGRLEPPSPKSSNFGHVQARRWAAQENLDVGVRFGVSLDQGKRCNMEDTAACLADALSVHSRGEENSSGSSGNPGVELSPEQERTVQPAAMTPAAGAGPPSGTAATEAATAANTATKANATTTTATAGAPEAAAYFGLFDGHGGADVAARLKKFLHLRVLNNPHFPSDIPQAIRSGCLETDLECLGISESKRQIGIEDVDKAVFAAASLKRQTTEQAFSGAVAVIAVIYRPPAPLAEATSDQPPPQPSSTGEATASLHSAPIPVSSSMVPGGIPATSAPLLDIKNAALVPSQPSHPQQDELHSRNNSSTFSARCQNKRQHRQPVFLHVANVGDCRAVLCRGGNAVAITTDHTPSVPSEAARVEAAGGFVSRGRVNGILGVSRSFGDIHCKVYPPREGNALWDNQQVISEPEVHSIELTEADNFLIMACDGVWDVLSNQEAVAYVRRRLLIHRDVQRAAVELVDKALVTSGDNCSCVVICLNQVAVSKKKRYRSSSSGSSRRPSLGSSNASSISGSVYSTYGWSRASSGAGSIGSFDAGAGASSGRMRGDINRGSDRGKPL